MEHKEWIVQAESDLRKANILFKGGEFDGVVFYSQQSAEKALKSVFIFLGNGLIRTHDLLLLGRNVKLPDNLLKKAVLLNPYYTSSRYPMSLTKKIILSESKIAINYAEDILEWCKKQIKI